MSKKLEGALRGRIPPPELMTPLHDRVLVRLDDEFGASMSSGESGKPVIVPGATKEPAAASGVVVRIGSKVEELQVGDRVTVVKDAGQKHPLPNARKDEHGKWIAYHEVEIIGYWRGKAKPPKKPKPASARAAS